MDAYEKAQKEGREPTYEDMLALENQFYEEHQGDDKPKNSLQDDAKAHLYLVSKSLESGPSIVSIDELPPKGTRHRSSHIVFVCPHGGEDEVVTLDSDENQINLFPSFFRLNEPNVNHDHETSQRVIANRAIQKSIKDDEKRYRKATSSNDALFPLPLNPGELSSFSIRPMITKVARASLCAYY